MCGLTELIDEPEARATGDSRVRATRPALRVRCQMKHTDNNYPKLFLVAWSSSVIGGNRLLSFLTMLSLAAVALLSVPACGGPSSTTVIPSPIHYTRPPSPTSIPTPTNIPTSPPTETPIPTIPPPSPTHTLTSTQAHDDATPPIHTGTPTSPTPATSTAPILLEPSTGQCYGGNVEFSWSWYRNLSDEGPHGGEYFAHRIWPVGGVREGSFTWTKETSYIVPQNNFPSGGADYYWNVAVVRQTGPDRDTQWELVNPESESEARWFCLHSEEPQPPTPTPPPPPPPPPTDTPQVLP